MYCEMKTDRLSSFTCILQNENREEKREIDTDRQVDR